LARLGTGEARDRDASAAALALNAQMSRPKARALREAAAMPEQLRTRCDVPTGAVGSERRGRSRLASDYALGKFMRVMIDGSAQRSIGERGICWGSRAGPSRSELCHCAMPHASCSGAHRK
jgi:hypothetical protein